MSAEAIGWVFNNSPYAGDKRVIHVVLADVVNDTYENRFWMPIREIARKARASERTVQYALRDMEEHGFIKQLKSGGGRGRPAEYRFLFPLPETVQHMHLFPPETVQINGANDAPIHGEKGANSESRVIDPKRSEELRSQELAADSDLTTKTPPPARRRDLIFEAVAEVCGIDWHQLTPAARGPLTRAVKELKGVNATPEEIRNRARRYRTRYRDRVDLTPTALSKHWAALSDGGGPNGQPVPGTWQNLPDAIRDFI